MSYIATIDPRRSVTGDMALRYGMEPGPFEQTLRATVFPANGTREEFAAFLLVAREYKLNPTTKEIFAFPKKGGGIVPVVSIDGWMNLINSNPQFDGMDFEEITDDGRLVSIKCTIYRKDRSHPVAVTEYLSECIRNTDPWKMKHRMLRHKAAIQCARYAFGFAGIYDEDEAEKIADSRPVDASPPAPPPRQINQTAQAFVDKAKEVFPGAEVATPIDFQGLVIAFKEALDDAKNGDEVESIWQEIVEPKFDGCAQTEQEELLGMHRKRSQELEP